jgi:hypothetical protein
MDESHANGTDLLRAEDKALYAAKDTVESDVQSSCVTLQQVNRLG